MHFRKSLPVSPFLYSTMWIPLKKKKKKKKCAPLATEKWTFHGIAQWLWDISSEQPWNETLIIPHLHRKFSPTLSNQAGLSLACKTCIYRRNCCSYPFVTLEYYSWKRFINRNKLVVVVVRELFERERCLFRLNFFLFREKVLRLIIMVLDIGTVSNIIWFRARRKLFWKMFNFQGIENPCK